MPTYSLWREPDGGLTLVRGTAPPACTNGDEQEASNVIVKEFKAVSWEEAMRIMHEFNERPKPC